jgi:hypothetical protein
MNHTYSAKGNRHYRYYTCHRAQKQGCQECPPPSIPAGEIERFVERVAHDGRAGKIAITFRPTGIKTLASELAERKDEAA